MIIGVPKEIKPEEKRVGLTPLGTARLVRRGHTVLVEHNAGAGCGIADASFREAGGILRRKPADLWLSADMILKVKEPLEQEIPLMREGQILFTFLHLAADKRLTLSLLRRRIVGIAYETVELADGRLPILRPMSEIAGHLAAQLAARGLEADNGGRGVVMGGISGIAPARVTIVGGGSAGCRAAAVASGLGAQVTVLEIKKQKISEIKARLGDRMRVRQSTGRSIAHEVVRSDAVIGALLRPGAKAPTVITEALVKQMQRGAVIVDIAVDQGGCCETIRPTTHARPFYSRHGVVHCGITNLPGVVPRSSTLALTRATLPFVIAIADKGWLKAARDNPALMKGINLMEGKVINRAVAQAFGISCHAV